MQNPLCKFLDLLHCFLAIDLDLDEHLSQGFCRFFGSPLQVTTLNIIFSVTTGIMQCYIFFTMDVIIDQVS